MDISRMKEGISHLPRSTQDELNYLTESIKLHIPKCAMVILYGSFARGGYVLWDERVEFGIPTSYQSDLDILVVTYESNARITEWQIEEKVLVNYNRTFAKRRHATPQFIVEDIHTLNRELIKNQYFYVDVLTEGIKLMDKGLFKLVNPPSELSYKEIRQNAQEEFNKCFPFANGFLKHASIALEDGMYELGAFELHQACERYYYSIGLVFVNYRPKTHRLKDLESKCKRFSRELTLAFPRNTEFEKHCYDLLGRAYIESRYNKDYTVTREEMEYMLERTKYLENVTRKICIEQFAVYDKLIEEEIAWTKNYKLPEKDRFSRNVAEERKGYK